MTITQTVEISADRRLIIDVPREVTADKAYVTVQFPVLAEAKAEQMATSKKIHQSSSTGRKSSCFVLCSLFFVLFSCYIYPMTITQTVEIPADRRITIEVPKEIPAGKAQIELKVIPFVKREKPVPPLSDTKGDGNRSETPISDSLVGILSHLGDITLEEIRDERLARHLK